MQQTLPGTILADGVGALLQILSLAAVGASAVLLAMRLIRPANRDGAAAMAPSPWFGHEQRRALAWAAAAAVGSRLALTAGIYAVISSLNGWDNPLPPLETILSRWDAPHYLDIARIGYTADRSLGDQWLFIVFYPLYPALTALLTPVFGSGFNSATALSWASLAGACYWIYRLALLEGGGAGARRAVKYLLVFPAAVFLGAPYTESLFLLLSALCLYALRRRCWWLAGCLGFLAALTRNLGALLAVPFLIELLDSLGAIGDWKKVRTAAFWRGFLSRGVWMLLIPLSIGVYLLINHAVYGDPLMFLKIQKNHWGQQAQLIHKTVQVTWSCLIGDRPPDEKLFLWAPQLAGMAAILIVSPILMRRLRPSLAAYLLVYLVVSLMPSWLLSFNRYIMGAVPLFLGIAALTENKWADRALTAVFAALMIFLAAGYVMWKMVV